jgi:hypothetical protein
MVDGELQDTDYWFVSSLRRFGWFLDIKLPLPVLLFRDTETTLLIVPHFEDGYWE